MAAANDDLVCVATELRKATSSNSFCLDRSHTYKRNPLTNPPLVHFAKSGSSPEMYVSTMMAGA